MVWKKDLEKLKQALGQEDPAPRKPVPKPVPKPAEARPIEDEDNMFLSAMGHRPKPQGKATPLPEQATAATPVRATPPPEPAGSEFAAAMGDLKGIVALQPTELRPAKAPPQAHPRPSQPAPQQPGTPQPGSGTEAPRAALPEPPPPPVPVRPGLVAKAPEPPEAVPALPVQINLAAGMAIDVDASLDLKGHGRNDAEERLKERILDAQVLSWRSLHVVLGPSEELRQMVLDLLKGPTGARIARYAQAPIPMGGSQAWILYFRMLPPPTEAP